MEEILPRWAVPHPFFCLPCEVGSGRSGQMLLPTAPLKSQTRSSRDDKITFQMMENSILLWESLENRATGTRGSELGSGCFKRGPWGRWWDLTAPLVPHPAQDPAPLPQSQQPPSHWPVVWLSASLHSSTTALPSNSPCRQEEAQAEADVPQAACIKVIIK